MSQEQIDFWNSVDEILNENEEVMKTKLSIKVGSRHNVQQINNK